MPYLASQFSKLIDRQPKIGQIEISFEPRDARRGSDLLHEIAVKLVPAQGGSDGLLCCG
jgi:hypothetical protein